MKKRRLLSILLTLCMVLALMPQMVFAEEGTATELQNMLNGGGTVKLEKDYAIDTTLEVNGTVTLDLNGHVIKRTGDGGVINVNSNGNLTLEDSNSEAEHDDNTLPAGGVITGGSIPYGDGGGVYVDGGSFTMAGGTIYKCSNVYGGGVYVDGGSFTMAGGAIYDCSVELSGGGVNVENDSSFTMNGGAIYDCSAEVSGGGVNVADSSFTMNGGAIYDCSAEASGGGVDVAASSFTMNGGAIYDCFAENFGDAVSVNIYSTVNANGGTIKGTVYSYGLIQKTATDGGCTRFYDEVTNDTTSSSHGTISGGIYYGGISGGGTVEGTYHTVSFDLNGGSGSIPKQWFVNIDTAQALEPVAPTREGYEFAGWYTDEELTTLYDFDNAVTGDITLYAGWGLSVPFTTTVKQDGNVAPGETTFNLELVDYKGNVLSPDDIEVTASITTNGAGNYDGTLTIEGTSEDIANMLRGKVFVKQAEGDYPNWEVDDTVWGLVWKEGIVAMAADDAATDNSVFIFPAEYVETENGGYYEMVESKDAVDKMKFTNTYTKSEDSPAEPEGTTGGDSDDNADKNAKTGDNVNLTLWITLMLLSVAGITSTAVYTRRKRTNE